MTDRMIARLNSNSFIRFAACSVGEMLASVYDQGIHVDRDEVERLKEIARKAERTGQSLILLPPHRSHIDYVTLQWSFFRMGLSFPLGMLPRNPTQ
jgi:glycerol-3-phosphate O-acyltransferase